MPLPLNSPIATPNGTEWRIAAQHFHEVESPAGAPTRLIVVFHLVDAGGNILRTAEWTCADFAAFVAEANGQTGTTVGRVRKAIFIRAQAEGTLGAGTPS